MVSKAPFQKQHNLSLDNHAMWVKKIQLRLKFISKGKKIVFASLCQQNNHLTLFHFPLLCCIYCRLNRVYSGKQKLQCKWSINHSPCVQEYNIILCLLFLRLYSINDTLQISNLGNTFEKDDRVWSTQCFYSVSPNVPGYYSTHPTLFLFSCWPPDLFFFFLTTEIKWLLEIPIVSCI